MVEHVSRVCSSTLVQKKDMTVKFILTFVPSEKILEHLKSEDSSSRRQKNPEGILLHLIIFKKIIYFSEAELWSFECPK